MILKAKKGMWFTQAKKDVKFRIFLKVVITPEDKKNNWVEWTDEQRKAHLSSKK